MTVVKDNNPIPETTGELLRSVTRLFATLQQRNFACCDVSSATQCTILTTLQREGGQSLSQQLAELPQHLGGWFAGRQAAIKGAEQSIQIGGWLAVPGPVPNGYRG